MGTTDIRYKISLEPGNAPANAKVVADSVRQIGQAGQASAAQTAAAMRSLPAQFTDVVTQLQGGASPMTILFQQGGQIKDQFGGVQAALGGVAKYMAGLVNPATVAAASVTAVAAAFVLGRQEADNYRAVLAKTGNAAGLTTDQLASMAKSVSESGGTQGKAAEVLTQLVETGRVSKEVMAQSAAGIIAFSKTSGVAVDQLVKDMAELGKAPADSLLKLNDSYHFLTASTYAHVVALEQQGRADEAARVAQQAYSDMLTQRGSAMVGNLGLVERAWAGVSGTAKSAWDAMLGVGREKTLDKKLAEARDRLASMQRMRAFNTALFGSSAKSVPEQSTEREIAGLERLKLSGPAQAASLAAYQRVQEEAAAGEKYLVNLRAQYDAKTRLKNATDAYLTVVQKLQWAGIQVSQEEQQRDLEHIRKANLDKDAKAEEEAMLAAGLATSRAASAARISLAETEARQLELKRAKGLLSIQDYEAQREKIEGEKIRARIALIDAEIAAEAKRKPDDKAGEITQQAKLTDLRGQRASAVADLGRLPLSTQAAAEARALAQSQADAKEWAATWQQANQFSQQLADSTATSMAQLITNPLARARAEAEVSVQQLERSSVAIRTQLQNQIDMLRGQGQAEMANTLQRQLDDIDKRMEAAKAGIRDKAGSGVVQNYLSSSIGTDLSAGFDKASQSLGTFVQGFSKLVDEQVAYGDAKKAAAGDAAKLAQIEDHHARAQLNSYAALAGAARGFMGERTAGYKLLTEAERAFRLFELGQAVASAATKIGLQEAEVGAKVAGDGAKAASESGYTLLSLAQSGARTAASAVEAAVSSMAGLPFPLNLAALAATVAALGALGVSVFGGGGGSGGFAATNSGTGTVLGDSGKASESIAKGIEALKQVDTATMRYSAQMLVSLQSIDSGIASMAAGLVQSGALSAATAGVSTGYRSSDLGGALGWAARGAMGSLMPFGFSELTGLGGVIQGLVGGLFGSKTSIQGQGISAGGQSVAQILAGGFDANYYADIETKKKFLGVTTSTDRYTQYTAADAGFESQVTKLVANYAQVLKSAAGPLGVGLQTVTDRVSQFVVDIGRVDLQGLSGDQIKEKLSGVFSAVGDQLAASALGGFTDFQRVGEGYLETVVRVASGTEEAQSALRHLGVTAVSLASLVDKQADVGAEQVKASLLAAEAASAGMTSIISTLTGSATELAQTYQSLTDVRTSLRLLGLDGQAVSFALVDGAGSLQTLSDGLAAFVGGFLSDSDQIKYKAGQMSAEFAKLGLALPATAADYVNLVNGIDTSTEAGQRLLGGVLSLSQGFSDLVSSISAVGSGIEDEIKRIQGLSVTSGSYAEIAAQFATSTAQARAGDAQAAKDLPSISQALLKAAQDNSSTLADYQSVQFQTLSSLKDTLALLNQTGLYTGSTSTKSDVVTSAEKTTSSVDEMKAAVVAAINSQTVSVNDTVAVLKKLTNLLSSVSNEGDSMNVRVLV